MELLSRLPKEELDVESCVLGTPIYAAAFRGRLQIVQILLEKGVDVNLGMRGESPLEAAKVEGHKEVAELLEKHGAIRTKEFRMVANSQGGLGEKLDVDASIKVLERVNTLEEEVDEEPDTTMRYIAEGEKSLRDPELYEVLSFDEQSAQKLLDMPNGTLPQ
jgi:ankyrin repeat protein